MNSAGTRGSTSAWSTAAVIVAIVVSGTVVAGFLNDPQSDAIAVPGCDEVVQPEDMQRINYAFVEDKRYADPTYGWFSETKATTMSDALLAALPNNVVVLPYSMFEPLRFVPFGSETTATGTISMSGAESELVVVVQQTDEPAGPCFAGYVDERRTLADGTVIDISEGENGGRARAHTSDGSLIDVSATGALTVEQLADIAATPGLRTR